MKKILLSLLFINIFFNSCSDDQYDNLNKDPNNPTKVSSGALFNSAVKSLFDQMTSTNVNTNVFRLFSQYWTETQYIDESNYDIGTRNINGNHWSEIYRDVLFDLQDAKTVLSSENLSASTLNNRKAIITVLEVYAWQQLVDTYGNIPYSQALQPTLYTSPSYDSAIDIYQSLFIRLDEAIAMFNISANGFSESDVIYNDDITKWKKLANSLKLRLAMRVSDVTSLASLSKQKAEEAVASGVFTSNSDNCIVNYSTSTPNPLYVDLVQSNRNDFVPANTIVDYMNALNDPRRTAYFDDNLGSGVYVGGIYGDPNTWALYTHIGDVMLNPAYKGVLLDYSETQFLLAFAASKSYSVGGTVEAFYNSGITASMSDWGMSTSNISSYLAQSSVNFSTAPGTVLQKIAKQFWIAMYNRGFEGWCVWRQFDAPVLNIAAESGDNVPTRFTYPVSEATYNKANKDAAALAIGGDNLYTKLFWDVN